MMRKIIALMFILLLSGCLMTTGTVEVNTSSSQFTILHLNDYHSHWEPFIPQGQKEPQGGFARIAHKILEVTADNHRRGIPTYVLEAGDILQGTVQSTVFKGEADIALRNQLPWGASALGNHEFDYGQENLLKIIKQAKFPFLAANIDGLTDPPWKPYIIIDSKGGVTSPLRIAIFGLTTADTPFTTHPKNVKGLKFIDPLLRAKAMVRELKPQADIIIALTHLGYEVDQQLAREVPEIDIIVGGHSHTKIKAPAVVGSTIIVTAYEYGEFLGRLDLTIKNKKIAAHQWQLIPIAPDIPEHQPSAALIAQYKTRLDISITEVVGQAQVDLIGEREAVRQKETNLGDTVADAFREATGTDIALVNGGNIRESILAGPITMAAIISTLPFDDNTIVTMKLTGRQIEAALNRSVNLPLGDGGFLQVSGLMFKVVQKKAAEILINGRPLNSQSYYRVAMTDFLAAGGDGYTLFLEGKDYYNTGLLPREAFAAYIKPRGVLEGKPDSRIIFIDEKR